MTSRERVLTALNHKEPDMVPIDFGAMRSTGIMAIGYNRLKRHLGISGGETRVYDTMQQLAEPEVPILDLFGVDSVDAGNSFGRHPDRWKDWTLPDGSSAKIPAAFDPLPDGEGGFIALDDQGRIEYRMPKGCLYFDMCLHPLENAQSISDLQSFEFPLMTDSFLESLRERAKWIYENTDYAIMGGFGGNILETGQFIRGWGNFMMDLAGATDFADYLMDKMVEAHIENLRRYLGAVGEYIQIIQMGDDLGTQSGPQLSPEMYSRTISPRHKKVYQYVKDNSDIKVFLHCCGSVYDLLPMIIDEGVDVINPVQTSAAKMDPRKLKKEFGDRIAFWGGGCDTQDILPNATPEEIDRHVRERIEIFAPGGGFVFTQIHNVQANIPPENVVAAYEAAGKYRK